MNKYRRYSLINYILILFVGFLAWKTMNRNNKVFLFRNEINWQYLYVDRDIYLEHHDDLQKLYERYTYGEMLLSFKPLKVKNWFTEEEISQYNLKLVDERCSKFFTFKLP